MLNTEVSRPVMICDFIAVVMPASVNATPENVGGVPVGFDTRILRASWVAGRFALALQVCAPREPFELSGDAVRSPVQSVAR